MKKSRILAVLLCLALAAGLVYGIGRAFAASRRKTVVVVPVTDLNYSWGDYENSMEGIVASGFSQDIYLMDTESVDTVLVEAGQHVKPGKRDPDQRKASSADGRGFQEPGDP